MRLFLAFDVPGRPGWHMTVVFLGSHPEEDVARIATAVEPVLGPAGPLQARRWLKLPRRHPRVLAAEFEDVTGRCSALQRAVAEALAAADLHAPERRRWLPHVSVLRLAGEEDPEPPAELEQLGFTPEALTLYESHLGRGPARHEALRSWPLPQS